MLVRHQASTAAKRLHFGARFLFNAGEDQTPKRILMSEWFRPPSWNTPILPPPSGSLRQPLRYRSKVEGFQSDPFAPNSPSRSWGKRDTPAGRIWLNPSPCTRQDGSNRGRPVAVLTSTGAVRGVQHFDQGDRARSGAPSENATRAARTAVVFSTERGRSGNRSAVSYRVPPRASIGLRQRPKAEGCS